MGAAHATGAPAGACPNCGARLAIDDSRPRHCPDCGQATTLHAPTFLEFVHEFADHHVALDGSVWRTLGNLLLKPGQLTLAYLRGQRGRYVLPLRVFLSASFVFFLVVKVLGVNSVDLEVDATEEARAAVAEDPCEPGDTDCMLARRAALDAIEGFRRDPARAHEVRTRMASVAPYAIFAMVPLAAGILQLAYRRRRRNFGEHFVFALHQHAFVFVAMLAAALLPGKLALVVLAVAVGHGLASLHRVYGGRWWATALRGALVGLLYLVALGLVTGGVATWAIRQLPIAAT